MLNKLIRRLFLVKEIKSKEGEIHFRRWRVLWTPWFAIYLHNILKSDEDAYPHNHPWSFISLILSGGYSEFLCNKDLTIFNYKTYLPGSLLRREKDYYHKITLLRSTWTLVWCGVREDRWGYLVDGEHVDFETYRKNKNEGKYESK